jgi:hypothetical protein
MRDARRRECGLFHVEQFCFERDSCSGEPVLVSLEVGLKQIFVAFGRLFSVIL